jgi:hypothetical protein
MKGIFLSLIAITAITHFPASAADGSRIRLKIATPQQLGSTSIEATKFVMTCRFLNDRTGRTIDWCSFFPRALGLYR